jgi:hypothetical protein
MAEQEGSVETGNPEWDTGLDDYRETIDAKGWKSAGDVLQSYQNLEKAVGADKVVLPSAEDNILEWDGWEKLGTPQDAADYAMAAPDGFEHYDTGLSDKMRQTFHEAKLTPAQAQHIHDKFVEGMMGNVETAQHSATDQQGQWETELKKEYGTAFDERIAAGKRALREYGGEEIGKILDQAGLGSNPVIVRAFVNAGLAMGHGPQLKDSESSGQFGTTPDAAKEQIAEIRANPALYDVSHAEYKVLNERLTRLTQQAYPEAPAG